jgi:hypothetical protein
MLLIFPQCYPLSSGARPVLPMGVAPEAIAEFFSGIDSKYTYCLLIFRLRYSWYDYALDARPNLFNCISPRLHEGVRCELSYTPLLFCHISFYPYSFACILSLSFVYDAAALFSARGKM